MVQILEHSQSLCGSVGKSTCHSAHVGKHVGHQVLREEDEAGVAVVRLVFVHLDKIIKCAIKLQKF